MSGCKRRTQYRKNVMDKNLHSFPLPNIDNGESIAKVVCSRGGNIFEIMLPEDEATTLCRLPTKFRNLIWVKRNDFVIISSADGDIETSKGSAGKVLHSIEFILRKDQIKHLKTENLWPKKFDEFLTADGDSNEIRDSIELKEVKDDSGLVSVSYGIEDDIKEEEDGVHGMDFAIAPNNNRIELLLASDSEESDDGFDF